MIGYWPGGGGGGGGKKSKKKCEDCFDFHRFERLVIAKKKITTAYYSLHIKKTN